MDQFKRIASFVLALVLVVLMAPVQFITANAAEQGATISFENVANRTEFTKEKQVWQQNGITVTGEKGASSSDVADYSNPARFYKNSKLTVAYPGMTQIVVTCSLAEYAGYLQTAASAVAGTSVTAESAVVTITLAEAMDSFVIEKLSAGKVFIKSMTVYADASAPVIPETTAPSEAPETTAPSEAPETTAPSEEPSETTPVQPAAQVTISFADKADRTEHTKEVQVWKQNGITVTNNKAASKTDVGDYGNPARFYQNSMLTVEYPGMTAIAFNCDDYKDYVTPLVGSISGAAVSSNGTVVTVTLAAAADSFVIENLIAQVRMDSITVYTGEVEIPEATEPEATQPTEPEVVEIVDIATAVAGAANEKFAVKGVVTVVDSSNYYVQDATGAICVRLAEKTAEISLGDTIIGTGTKSVYNGMPQLQNATYEMSSGMELVAKETTVDALTAADICTYVTIKGLTVTEVNDNNGQYTTPNISTVDAAGNPIQIYKAVVAKDGDAWAIKVGDVIDVTAGVGCYKETLQLRNTLSTEIVLAETGAEPDAPVDPSEPEATEPTAPSEPEETQPTAPSEEPTAPSEEPTEPANPAGPAIVEKPVAGTAYKFGMAQGNLENKVYYLVGGMNGYYMATTEDATAALDVYLEETDGGYYLYAMADGAKQYINMVVSGTHVNGAYEAEASTVYTYDAEAGTVVATVEDAPYWFGTRNDKTYTTVGPCKVEYEGFYCRFYTVSEGGETPSEPENTQPTEPEVTDPTEPSEEPTAPSEEPTEPANPAGPAIVEKPVAGTAYKFGMAQGNLENKVYYLVGGMNGYYMATTEDATAALDVYLEETDGGYYLYAMADGAKQYINMVVSGTHVNGAYEAEASTVYTYDAEAGTVVATVEDAPYWFGTRNDKTYTTVGPCKVEYEGFYCRFYTVSEGGETPSEPEATQPTEPEATQPTEPEATQPTEPETNEIVDIATALAGADGTKFTVKGVVTAIDSSNYYVQDTTGAICVRMASKPTDVALGDTIIGTGTKSVYNGMPQLQSATYELSSGMKLTAKETTVSALTIADICTYVTIKGLTVTEIYDNNGQYTNPNVTTVDAEGNTIQIYKATVAKEGDTWAIQVGDVIDVTAAVGYHVDKFQLRNTLASEIVLADNEPTVPPAEPGDPSDPVTLVDFNGDGVVTDADAVYLLRHTLFAEEFPITLDGDVNGDGETTDADAVYLLRYTLFPEEFPLKK